MHGPTMFFQPINGGSLGPFGHLGPAASVAYDPRAPLDETQDADRQLMKTYGGDPAGVLGGPDVMALLAEFAHDQQQSRGLSRPVTKALGYKNPTANDAKAHDEAVLQRMGGGAGGRYAPKPGIPFQGLRLIARRIEIVQAIIRQRQRQVLSFCEPAKLDSEPGWMLGAAEQDAVLSSDHTDYLHWLQQMLLCGGRRFDPLGRRIHKNEDFRTFLSKLVSDSLTLDHVAIETVPLRGALGLDSFFVRDSATFYLATGVSAESGIYAYQDLTLAQQIEFKHDELFLLQRNPQTDLEWAGYSYGELEAGIDTISTVLSAFSYTRESLDNNAIPRGIMVVSGNYDASSWGQFQTAWQQKIRGAANSHGLPVMKSQGQVGDVKYIQTGAPVSEMAFAKWISLQVAILCSLYGMDPTEIGMEGYAAEKSSMSGDDTSERLASSKDKGLRPLLRDVSSVVSDNILARFTPTPWARFRFTGFNQGSEEKAGEERARLSTVDELRGKHGMKPHPIAWLGALPADPGQQAAEFQRLNSVATVGEGRAAWGGLPAYPDATVNSAPLSPSLQSVYNMALQAAAQEAQADTIAPDGSFSDQPDDALPPEEGLGSETLDRLKGMGPGEEPAPGEEGPGEQ